MGVQPQSAGVTRVDISVRPLQESDLPTADHIMRLAFGTFLGLPEPTSFMGDASYVRTRWHADPTAAFGAEVGGELVGSNFATNWGSVGFFGPLTIRPDLWDRGVGKRLMEPIMNCFARWGTKPTLVFSPSPTARSTSAFIRSLASGRGSSPRSCRNRSSEQQVSHDGQCSLRYRRASGKLSQHLP